MRSSPGSTLRLLVDLPRLSSLNCLSLGRPRLSSPDSPSLSSSRLSSMYDLLVCRSRLSDMCALLVGRPRLSSTDCLPSVDGLRLSLPGLSPTEGLLSRRALNLMDLGMTGNGEVCRLTWGGT